MPRLAGLPYMDPTPYMTKAIPAAHSMQKFTGVRIGELDREITDIDFNRSVIGPTFRKQAPAFMEAVRALAPGELANPPKTIFIGNDEVEIPENAFSPRYSYMEEGAKVDVITVGDVIVTIAKTA